MKKIILLLSMFTMVQSMADYSARVPLESSQGGSLENGSIIFSSNSSLISPENFSQDKSNAICHYNVDSINPWNSYSSMESWFITLAGSPPTTWSGYVTRINISGVLYNETQPMYSNPSGVYNIGGIDFFPGDLKLIEYYPKAGGDIIYSTNLTYDSNIYQIIGQHYEICYIP